MTTPVKNPFAFTHKQPMNKDNAFNNKSGGPMVIGGNRDKYQTTSGNQNQFMAKN